MNMPPLLKSVMARAPLRSYILGLAVSVVRWSGVGEAVCQLIRVRCGNVPGDAVDSCRPLAHDRPLIQV